MIVWGSVSIGYRKAEWRLNDIFNNHSRICETNILLLNGKSHVDAQDHEFHDLGCVATVSCL